MDDVVDFDLVSDFLEEESVFVLVSDPDEESDFEDESLELDESDDDESDDEDEPLLELDEAPDRLSFL